MTRTLARIVDSKGQILLPPAPSHMYIEDGKPVLNLTLEMIEEAALRDIVSQREPKVKSVIER